MKRLILGICSILVIYGLWKRSKDQEPHSENLGKKLTFAWEFAPRTIDSRFTSDANSQYLSDLINCSLINFDKSGMKYGQLASSWKWNDGKTLTFDLKKNVKFSDGTLLTSEDVLATYEFLTKPQEKASPLQGAFSNVKSVKALDAHKIEFVLKKEDATFVDNLFIGILPKALASRDMISDEKELLGCGAFKLQNVGIGDYILVANKNYSLGPIPKLSEVHIKIVKDDSTRVSKLLKGEIDLVQNALGRDQVLTLTENSNLKIQKVFGLNVSYMGFNFKDPILSNRDVREAISLGIDRQSIINVILKGMASPASGFLHGKNPYKADLKAPSLNLDKAETLLDKAGFPRKGEEKIRFHLDFKMPAEQTRVNIAYAIAGQLRELGIKVNVQTLEWGKFKSDVDKGLVQVWLLNWIGYKDPDIYRYAFSSESFPPYGVNRGRYKNAELDPILEKAQRTHIFEQRRELYLQAQKIVEKDIPYAFLWHEENFVVYNSKVKNFEIYADGRYSSLKEVDLID